jgi:hypothetical protein
MQGNTERARAVPYISFDAVVGHNSSFEELTEEQLEELGGVEFRALNALLWIVGIVGSSALLLYHWTYSFLDSVSYLCAIGLFHHYRSLHVIG